MEQMEGNTMNQDAPMEAVEGPTPTQTPPPFKSRVKLPLQTFILFMV
jgi:hypothetical protein